MTDHSTTSIPRNLLANKAILVTGGTGSLGQALVERLLSGRHGLPARVVVFSRDEAKQHDLRVRWGRLGAATDGAIWQDSQRIVKFRVGDVRDAEALSEAAAEMDIIVHAAAMKQVPTCEYFPEEAVRTNVLGGTNVVRAARRAGARLRCVVGVSTDKAVKPVNVMGMGKALQERILAAANLDMPACRFVLVRYGNVLASRGSVVPLFAEQIAAGGPVTVTHPDMTRFLLTLDGAVDTVVAAIAHALPGETLVPRIPTARIIDLAQAMIGQRPVELRFTGIRPGEKMHEILISDEERLRTVQRAGYYAVGPILPEIPWAPGAAAEPPHFAGEYSSADGPLPVEAVAALLRSVGLLQATA